MIYIKLDQSHGVYFVGIEVIKNPYIILRAGELIKNSNEVKYA